MSNEDSAECALRDALKSVPDTTLGQSLKTKENAMADLARALVALSGNAERRRLERRGLKDAVRTICRTIVEPLREGDAVTIEYASLEEPTSLVDELVAASRGVRYHVESLSWHEQLSAATRTELSPRPAKVLCCNGYALHDERKAHRTGIVTTFTPGSGGQTIDKPYSIIGAGYVRDQKGNEKVPLADPDTLLRFANDAEAVILAFEKCLREGADRAHAATEKLVRLAPQTK